MSFAPLVEDREICYISSEPIKVNPGKSGGTKLQTYVVRMPGRPEKAWARKDMTEG